MLIKILVFFLILIAIVAVGVIVFDSNRFVMREYTIESDKVSRDYDFVFLSDLHNKKYSHNNEELLKTIDSIPKDLLLIGGDMMTAVKNANFDTAVSFLERVAKLSPYFYTLGNHESRARANKKNHYGTLFYDYCTALNKAGVVLSDNTCFKFEDVTVWGVTAPEHFYNKRKREYMTGLDVTECIKEAPKDTLNLVLLHNPEFFDGACEWGADVVLSGHYHGGIVRVPFIGKGVISPRMTLFPKYDGGLYTKGKSHMIVSRGLGMHTIPLRMFNPGEIVVLHIKRT